MYTETTAEGDTRTHFPELLDYLKEQLSKLGEVVLEPLWESFTDHQLAHLTFPEFPKVFDRRKTDDPKYLFLNRDGGGVFTSGGHVTYWRHIPRPDRRNASFLFEIFLDSRSLPLEYHTAEYFKAGIDEFVSHAAHGYCYFWREPFGE